MDVDGPCPAGRVLLSGGHTVAMAIPIDLAKVTMTVNRATVAGVGWTATATATVNAAGGLGGTVQAYAVCTP